MRFFIAVSLDLFHSTAMLIYSTLGIELRIDRCLIFKDYIMRMITDEMPRFHPRYSYRILYVGNDLMLSQFLEYTLEDCQVIRCPYGSQARLFIEKIKYSLLLFDEELPDTTGVELESYTRTIAGRGLTPIIIIKKSDDLDSLARSITHRLAKLQ